MQRLIEFIYNYIFEGKEVPEDLMFEFSQSTMKIVQSGNVQELPPEFEDLQNYVELFWRGRKYEREEKPIRIYQLGQLLSYINLIRDVADEQKRKISMEEYAERWSKRFRVFLGMHVKPGIMHKELAKFSGITPSVLSQFVAKTKWDGYYTYRIVGREKYYYLTSKGQELYSLLWRKQNRENLHYYLPLDAYSHYDEIAILSNNNIYKQDLVKKRLDFGKRVVTVNQEKLPIRRGGYKMEVHYGNAANQIRGYKEKDSGHFEETIGGKTGVVMQNI